MLILSIFLTIAVETDLFNLKYILKEISAGKHIMKVIKKSP